MEAERRERGAIALLWADIRDWIGIGIVNLGVATMTEECRFHLMHAAHQAIEEVKEERQHDQRTEGL